MSTIHTSCVECVPAQLDNAAPLHALHHADEHRRWPAQVLADMDTRLTPTSSEVSQSGPLPIHVPAGIGRFLESGVTPTGSCQTGESRRCDSSRVTERNMRELRT